MRERSGSVLSMKFLILFAILCILADSRSLPDDEDSDYDESGETSTSNVACRVQGTSLKICRECDPRYQVTCLPKPYSDCRCRDISYINERKNFQFTLLNFGCPAPRNFLSKYKYVDGSASKNDFWRFSNSLDEKFNHNIKIKLIFCIYISVISKCITYFY